MTSAERGRKRRALLRAAGLCLDCGVAPFAAQRTRCPPCARFNAETAKARLDRRRTLVTLANRSGLTVAEAGERTRRGLKNSVGSST